MLALSPKQIRDGLLLGLGTGFITLRCVLLTLPANAATITSNGTGGGNWNSGASWAGGTAPGSGDSAVIANGDTITVPVSTTVTVGTSPADDTGTAAIATASTSGTGQLVVNGTLVYRGPVRLASATIVGPGAILTHDSSPRPPRRRITPGSRRRSPAAPPACSI